VCATTTAIVLFALTAINHSEQKKKTKAIEQQQLEPRAIHTAVQSITSL
jgi:hypothetical protein